MQPSETIILNHPGLGNSGPMHWQSQWELKNPTIIRVEQLNWETPVCDEWIKTLDGYVRRYGPENVIYIGHSLACTTLAYWSARYNRKLKGAMLVAPSDTEAETYPPGTSGYSPVPLVRFSFPTIVVASTNDFYVSLRRANEFSDAWGSQLVSIGDAGHINVASGFGPWDQGIAILKNLF